jgi:hypothetical protein
MIGLFYFALAVLVSPFSSQQCGQFCALEGSSSEIERLFSSDSRRFVISYDLAVRQAAVLAAFMVRHPVHLVLDEAHRMKAGLASQRGAFLLGVATLPFRIGNGTAFTRGRDFAAWLGLVPKQISTGDRTILGRITKRGNYHLLDFQ